QRTAHRGRTCAIIPRSRGASELETLLAVHVQANDIPRTELAFQYPLRERVLELLLYRTTQRARSVHGIEARLAEAIQRRIGNFQAHVAFGEPLPQVIDLDVGDATNLFAAQRTEHDRLVDAIDELRPEMLADDLHYRVLHRVVVPLARVLRKHFLD